MGGGGGAGGPGRGGPHSPEVSSLGRGGRGGGPTPPLWLRLYSPVPVPHIIFNCLIVVHTQKSMVLLIPLSFTKKYSESVNISGPGFADPYMDLRIRIREAY